MAGAVGACEAWEAPGASVRAVAGWAWAGAGGAEGWDGAAADLEASVVAGAVEAMEMARSAVAGTEEAVVARAAEEAEMVAEEAMARLARRADK